MSNRTGDASRPVSGAIPNVLSIAGSDPSGGAGVQADLKAFSALGAYGMCALTALTAQNTLGVRDVLPIDPAFLRAQIEAVFDDVEVAAVKVGMVGAASTVAVVAECIERYRPPFVIVDPVMVAKSGDRLLDEAAVETLRDRLLPLATLITPNLPEGAVLLGESTPAADTAAMERVGERLRAGGVRAALVKGGHLPANEPAVDVLCEASGATHLQAPRVATGNTHGTGCTLSSAIAALLPRAPNLATAVGAAKRYLSRDGVGTGHGPVHHFADAWRSDPADALLARLSQD